MTGADTAAAAFAALAATHEDRLVRSLVSETGLSPAAARAVAADVLPAAAERSFASDGAAYGWLRVAARHRAAGSAGWAAAADAALGSIGPAAAAFAGLSAADRELLRLRYVEGLLPAAVAARLGTSVDEVLARLDRVRGTATRSLAPRRALAVPLPRAAAALAAAAAAAFVSFGGGTAGTSAPPAFAGRVPVPYADVVAPALVAQPGAEEPAAANGRVPVRRAAAASATARPGVVVVAPPPPATVEEPPTTTCRTRCRSPRRLTDELHVRVPSELEDVAGEEVVVKQEVAQDVVSLCETVPAIPAGVASCVPAEH